MSTFPKQEKKEHAGELEVERDEGNRLKGWDEGGVTLDWKE